MHQLVLNLSTLIGGNYPRDLIKYFTPALLTMVAAERRKALAFRGATPLVYKGLLKDEYIGIESYQDFENILRGSMGPQTVVCRSYAQALNSLKKKVAGADTQEVHEKLKLQRPLAVN